MLAGPEPELKDKTENPGSWARFRRWVSESGWTIHDAVRHKNLDSVKYHLSGGVDINHRKPFDLAPLAFAVDSGANHHEIIDFLIENGADLEARDQFGRTPILLAIQRGYLDYLIKLHQHGANLHVHDYYGRTAMHNVMCRTVDIDSKKFEAIIDYLIENGLLIDAVDNEGNTLLHLLAYTSENEYFNILLSKGASLQARNNLGQTVQHFSAKIKHNGIDWNAQDHNGQTPLHYAIKSFNEFFPSLKKISKYIQLGADINKPDNDGNTPLHLAASLDRRAVVRKLLEKDANQNALNRDNQTPLEVAFHKGHSDLIAIFKFYEATSSASINGDPTSTSKIHEFKTEKTHIPVLEAVSEGDLNMVKRYLYNGGNINARHNSNGDTLLHIVVSNKLTDGSTPRPIPYITKIFGVFSKPNTIAIFNFLIENGADPEARDKEGMTPLLRAVQNENLECVKKLHKHGANLHVRDNKGRTAIHYAVFNEKSCSATLDYLLANGLSIDTVDKEGNTALHFAMGLKKSCTAFVINTFLNKGASRQARNNAGQTVQHLSVKHKMEIEHEDIDWDAQDHFGQTPLFYLFECEDAEILPELLKKGANPDIQDNNGNTIAHLAARLNREDILEILLRSYLVRDNVEGLLLERKADLQIMNDDLQTPIEVAFHAGHMHLVELFNEHFIELPATRRTYIPSRGRADEAVAADAVNKVTVSFEGMSLEDAGESSRSGNRLG